MAKPLVSDQLWAAVEPLLPEEPPKPQGGRFDAINERFDHQSVQFDQRLDQMGVQFDQRLDAINEAMRRQTRWTVGAIIVIGAILSVLLSIAEFAA